MSAAITARRWKLDDAGDAGAAHEPALARVHERVAGETGAREDRFGERVEPAGAERRGEQRAELRAAS